MAFTTNEVKNFFMMVGCKEVFAKSAAKCLVHKYGFYCQSYMHQTLAQALNYNILRAFSLCSKSTEGHIKMFFGDDYMYDGETIDYPKGMISVDGQWFNVSEDGQIDWFG